MKNLYTIVVLLASTAWLQAQITVTNATFPVAGDSLKTATDLNPNGITITSAGGPFTWDFTTLNPDINLVNVYQPASEGDAFGNFPDAELVTIGQTGNEIYYDVSTTSFNNLGFSGSDAAAGLPIQTVFKFTTPVPERRAPLTFPSNLISESSVAVAFSLADIPGGVLDSLGIPTGFVDSIRIRVTTSRNDFVDAYGNLAIPGGAYDVLREKRTEDRDTRVDVLLPFLGWSDITDQLGAGAFGQQTITTYHFFSATEKEPIAVVTMDSSGLTPAQVSYKDNGIPNATDDVASAIPQVLVSPNPASGMAVFELKNFAPGNYSLRLLDARGAVVFEQKSVSTRSAISLAGFAEGTYFYQVFDEKNQVNLSGKLLKINR